MSMNTKNAKLTLDDIADLRAYERDRADFRRHIIDLKRGRRVAVGPIVTLLFENRDTIRFQIQEMARAEKMLSDEAIETELGVYNPLIPSAGELSATLFIELTSKEELIEWLPKLVGIETALELRIGDDPNEVIVVKNAVDPEHEKQLTREEITASVHYVRWSLSPEQVERFAAGPVTLAIAHPTYAEEVELSPDTRESLLDDLRG
ncbi:MAG: DUF3501 family protein [Actinomycetota bacterium]